MVAAFCIDYNYLKEPPIPHHLLDQYHYFVVTVCTGTTNNTVSYGIHSAILISAQRIGEDLNDFNAVRALAARSGDEEDYFVSGFFHLVKCGHSFLPDHITDWTGYGYGGSM